ncbi:Chemotaxis protein CheA [compost metagenome]
MSADDKKDLQEQQDSVVTIDFEQVEEVSRAFFQESQEILEGLDQIIMKLEDDPSNADHINMLFRKVHTLKGSVGAVPGGQLFGSLAHEFEALLTQIKRESRKVTKGCIDLFLNSSRLLSLLAEALREKREVYPEELSEAIELITEYGSFQFTDIPGGASEKKRAVSKVHRESDVAEEGVWLSIKQFNDMQKLSGELLVIKNFFQMMNQTVNFRTEPELFERRQSSFSQSLAKISEQFQNHIQAIRKEKAEESFQGLQVLVRQASTELNKTVQLHTSGLDMWIDKALGRDLYESSVHLVRNSIDHGIEDQFERTVEGKPSMGQIYLDIKEINGVIHLEFRDDGKGLDRERILARAVKNGLVRENEVSSLTDQDVFQFIFEAGFSTKDKITTISGRGVGMDVVMTTVEKYGGHIQIESQPGKGSCFKLIVPIPQNVMVESSLLCTWRNLQVAVPLTAVAHISSCEEMQVTHVDHLRYCQFNGMTVPLMTYQEMKDLRVDSSSFDADRSSAIFIKSKQATVALLVDRIESQTDLVIKPFGKIIGQMKGFKGISILADERVAYVIEPEELMSLMVIPSMVEAA